MERIAEIHLGHGPIERRARAGIFLQGLAIGGNGLLQPRGPALPLTQSCERRAEVHLCRGPLERHARAGIFLPSFAKGGNSLVERAVRLSRSPSRISALP